MNKFFDDPNEKDLVRYFYNVDGKQIPMELHETRNEKEHDYVAKMTFDRDRGEKTAFYFIKMYRGQLLDPHSNDKNISQMKRRAFVERRVNSRCFDNYLKYLQTKNRTYFTRSRRLSMEN